MLGNSLDLELVLKILLTSAASTAVQPTLCISSLLRLRRDRGLYLKASLEMECVGA